MPTKNLEIKITVNKSTTALLVVLAQKEGKSVEVLAEELILEAIEYREDRALSATAEYRDRDSLNSKKIKHEDAWK